MNSSSKLNTEIEKIKERNNRVEADKAWETSPTRKITLIILTYIVIAITFTALDLPDPLLNALIPSIAFFLSTLTLPLFKKIWINNFYKN